jgi:archaellum component FlaC
MPKTAKEAFEKQAELAPKVAAAEADVERQKMNLETGMLEAKGQAAQESADKTKAKIQDTRDKELLLPRPEFHPTKENAESLGSLFSMVATFGLMMGNSGKLASQNALGAMTGMLKGWQEGRQDLYERELKEFEKNYQKIKDMREDLRKDLEDYYKVAPLDREAGQAKLEVIARKAGTNSVLGSYANNRNLSGLQDIYKSSGNFLQKEEELRIRRADSQRNARDSYQYVEKDGKVYAINKNNPMDIREVDPRVAGATTFGKDKKPPPPPKKGEVQANDISREIGRPIDVQTAGKIAGTWNFIKKLEDLKKQSKELGEVSGFGVAIAEKMNRFMTSRYDANGEITTDTLQEDFNNSLKEDKSFKRLSDKSKVMAKAELDAVMAFLQEKYGNRAPVAEFKAGVNALSRQSSSGKAFSEIMDAEIKSSRDRLVQTGITANEAKKAFDYYNKTSLDYEKVFGSDKSTTETSQSKTPKEGDTDKSKSGKAIIFRDGEWHYVEEK